MRSTLSTHVRAPAPLLFALARDVSRWPDLLPHYVRADPLPGHGSVVRFVARRPFLPVLGIGLPVAWRARVESGAAEPGAVDLRLRFDHLGGATGGMQVAWRIEPRPDGCRVTIEHHFAPRYGPWASFVDRLFVRPIASRTLASFRAIAESVAAAGAYPTA
jgi:ribosome-associated toxin RatA of RatAB toxin-antitoxin module